MAYITENLLSFSLNAILLAGYFHIYFYKNVQAVKIQKTHTGTLGTVIKALMFLVLHHQFVPLHLLIFTISLCLSYFLRFIYGLVGVHCTVN